MRHSLYLWIAVFGALAVFAVPVTAQEAKPKRGDFFKERDKNGDGRLTRDELSEQLREQLEPLFERLGKDGLTREDLMKSAARRQGGPGAPEAGRGPLAAKRAEEFFKRLDTNGDGKITKDEVPEQAKRMVEMLLRKAGKEQGDSISKEELSKLMAQRPGPGGQPGAKPRGPQPRSGGGRLPLFFQKLDSDKDGKLSKDELAKAAEKLDELDSNKDGKLDPRELLGPGPGSPGGSPSGHHRSGERPQGADRPGTGDGEFAERLFKKVDKNSDGKISKDEAPEKLEQNFSKFDANSDGVVDLDEFKTGFPNPGKQRPEGRPGAQRSEENKRQAGPGRDSAGETCKVLADERLEGPLRTIAAEFQRRTGTRVVLSFLPAAEVNALVEKKETGSDAALCMAEKRDGKTSLDSLPGAKKVAWKHPSGEPVWGVALTEHPEAAGFVSFVGGPTGHRLWSESKAGFTITTGKTHAEAFEWVVENRVKHTYPLTAMRMLRELGGIREGICIDIGCGTGNLDVELAKRSDFTIIGLDIDPDMKPLFEKRIHEADLQDRARFVEGDAQQLPFEDDFADVIVSRGTLTFIPDIGKCLREVDRVLKPTGGAFLGGRYLYTPQSYKISNEKLKKIVAESGVPGAKVVEHRGQWVKIVGPEAPKAAHQFQGGPHMLANRFIADYAITEGSCLLICPNDSGGVQGLQQGFVEATDLEITALYPSEKVAGEAQKRISEAKLSERISCEVGTLDVLPFEEASFDLIAGAGPVLIWGDREKKMREVYRVLRQGGVAFIGGRYLGMPDFRKVSSEDLRASAAKTGISSIQVVDNMGQWVEIRKGIQDRGLRD